MLASMHELNLGSAFLTVGKRIPCSWSDTSRSRAAVTARPLRHQNLQDINSHLQDPLEIPYRRVPLQGWVQQSEEPAQDGPVVGGEGDAQPEETESRGFEVS